MSKKYTNDDFLGFLDDLNDSFAILDSDSESLSQYPAFPQKPSVNPGRTQPRSQSQVQAKPQNLVQPKPQNNAANEALRQLKQQNEHYSTQNAKLKNAYTQYKRHYEQLSKESEVLKQNAHKIKNENERFNVLIQNLNEEIKEIQNHKLAYVNEVKALRTKGLEHNNQLNEQKQSLAKLNQELQIKTNQLQDLQKKFLDFREQTKNLATSFENQQKELEHYKTKKAEFQQALRESHTVIERQKERLVKETSYIKKIEELNNEIVEYKADLSSKNQKITSLATQLQDVLATKTKDEKNWREILVQKDNHVAAKEKEIEDQKYKVKILDTQLFESKKQIESFKLEIQRVNDAVTLKKHELEKMSLTLGNEVEEKNQSQTIIKKLEAQIRTQSENEQKLHLKLSTMEDKLKAESLNNHTSQKKLSFVEKEKTDLERMLLEAKAQISEQRQTERNLKNLNEKLEESNRAKAGELLKAHQIKEVVLRTNESLALMQADLIKEKATNEEMVKKIYTLHSKITSLNEEKKQIVSDNQVLKEGLKTAEMKTQAMTRDMTNRINNFERKMFSREQQMQNYKNWLNASKFFVTEKVEECVGTISQTLNSNLVMGYIEIINNEIIKLDTLLSSTNVFGSMRAHYQEMHGKLTQQKNDAEILLKDYAQNIEDKIQSLKQVLKDEVLLETPPLPPKDPEGVNL